MRALEFAGLCRRFVAAAQGGNGGEVHLVGLSKTSRGSRAVVSAGDGTLYAVLDMGNGCLAAYRCRKGAVHG